VNIEESVAAVSMNAVHLVLFIVQMSNENQKSTGGTLVAFLSGDAANIIFDKSDEEIVDMCVSSLCKLFPEEVTETTLVFFTHEIIINNK